jgi:glycosyltransferase involved in cell wall biosynthesis
MSVIKFSVLMSVYYKDNALFFQESVKSLLSQTLPPDQIVVVKDGPLPVELDLILFSLESEYKHLIVVVSLPMNLGLARALNFGFKFIKYDIIARMDSDDICIPNRFEVQIPYMVINKLDLIGGQICEFVDNPSNVVSFRVLPTTHERIVKFMKWRSPFNHPTIIFSRKLYETVNGYDEVFFPEDYMFFVKSFMAGFKFANVSDFVLNFRLGSAKNSSLKRRLGMQYALSEYKLYREFRRLKFISIFHLFLLLITKIPLRFLPPFLFRLIYKLSRYLK